jgi:hypothetical protein
MIVTNPLSALRSPTRAQVDQVSKGWWVLLASGVPVLVAFCLLSRPAPASAPPSPDE